MQKIVLSIVLGSCIFIFQNCAGGMPDIQQDVNASSRANGGCSFGAAVVPNHGVIPAYSIASGASAGVCSAAQEQRTCTDGVLSGSFQFASCTVATIVSNKVDLVLATNATDYNIAAAAGAVSGKVDVTLTINPGVVVSASSTGIAALSTGSFPAGSTLQIVNNGRIAGAGGAGGKGGQTDANGLPGSPGGPALSVSFPVSITNAGVIAGGGGGGGGAAGCIRYISGGGGGGGAGSGAGAGGVGGSSVIAQYVGGTGAAGSLTSGGAGGVGANNGGTPLYPGNDGGVGGAPGMPGATGANSSALTYTAPAPGGAAGAAVLRNGNATTFISGGSAPNILGAIQ